MKHNAYHTLSDGFGIRMNEARAYTTRAREHGLVTGTVFGQVSSATYS